MAAFGFGVAEANSRSAWVSMANAVSSVSRSGSLSRSASRASSDGAAAISIARSSLAGASRHIRHWSPSLRNPMPRIHRSARRASPARCAIVTSIVTRAVTLVASCFSRVSAGEPASSRA